MSFAALAWAAKQRPGNLAAKMVLLGLANFADEHGCAYPSTAALAEFGDMDHKTATAALDRLDALNLISDTGEREGRTRQIKVYQLAIQSLPKAEASQKRKPPVSAPKAPQKRGTDTVKEPVPKKDKPSLVAHEIPESWEPRQFGEDTKSRKVVDGWPPGELEYQLEHFRAHHRKKGSKFKDWQDGWSTWVLNWRSFGNGRNQQSLAQPSNNLRGSRPDPCVDMLRQANAQLEEEAAGRHSGFGGEAGLALPAICPS